MTSTRVKIHVTHKCTSPWRYRLINLSAVALTAGHMHAMTDHRDSHSSLPAKVRRLHPTTHRAREATGVLGSHSPHGTESAELRPMAPKPNAISPGIGQLRPAFGIDVRRSRSRSGQAPYG